MSEEKKLNMPQSLLLLLLIIGSVAVCIRLKTGGPMIGLFFSWIIIYLFCKVLRINYEHVVNGAYDAIRVVVPTLCLLMAIGVMIGTWLQSGTIATIIAGGLKLIDPTWLLPLTPTELTQIQGTAACFILDNNRGDKINLNEQFADDFNSFLEIPEKYKSLRGNIDRAEIEETLKAHGMAMIVHAQGVDSSQVIQALTDNEYAPAEADRTVKYITAALAGNVSMEDLEKAVGTPVDTFRAYSGEESICCVCGMTYPKMRLEEMYNKVAENKDTIRKNLEATQETAMQKDINFLNELQPKHREVPSGSGSREERRHLSKRDILNKYL